MSASNARRARPAQPRLREVPVARAAAPPPEVVLGQVRGVDAAGRPLVDFPGNRADGPIPALATATFGAEAIGRSVALLFIGGDPAAPLALGLVAAPPEPAPAPDRLVLNAGEELTLRCGHASITLTREGKVLLRGTNMSLRSSGVQRIIGATLQLN